MQIQAAESGEILSKRPCQPWAALKLLLNSAILTITMLFALNAAATTFYVNVKNPSPVSPYTNWNSAATAIQDAVDETSDGDLVLVTNGIYSAVFGGGAYQAILTNCIVANNAANLMLASNPNGHLGGGTLDSQLYNCSLSNNYSATRGGGTCRWTTGGAACNCLYYNNSAPTGAGSYGGSLTSCTLFNNAGNDSYSTYLYNCILKDTAVTAAYGAFRQQRAIGGRPLFHRRSAPKARLHTSLGRSEVVERRPR